MLCKYWSLLASSKVKFCFWELSRNFLKNIFDLWLVKSKDMELWMWSAGCVSCGCFCVKMAELKIYNINWKSRKKLRFLLSSTFRSFLTPVLERTVRQESPQRYSHSVPELGIRFTEHTSFHLWGSGGSASTILWKYFPDTKTSVFRKVCSMPDTVFNALPLFSHVYFMVMPWGGNHSIPILQMRKPRFRDCPAVQSGDVAGPGLRSISSLGCCSLPPTPTTSPYWRPSRKSVTCK